MFTLKIEMGNAAMQDGDDISRALIEVAEKVAACNSFGRIKDINGSTVGEWALDYDAMGVASDNEDDEDRDEDGLLNEIRIFGKYEIKIWGKDEEDLDLALTEAILLIEEGCVEGTNENTTGGFFFN